MNFKNLALGYVATAPSPATTGTSLTLDSGEGARFPQPSTDGNFYVTAMPPAENPHIGNSEILQVTARSTDTLTIVRGQGDTTAKTIEEGWVILQSIYKENILDEDDMASNSDTALATQQSIKAYSDSGTQTLTNKTLTNPVINMGDSMPSTNVRCSVYLSADITNLVNSTDTLITFDTENFDTGNDFDISTHTFTAPVAGYYLIQTGIRVADASGNLAKAGLVVKKNTTTVLDTSQFQPYGHDSDDGAIRSLITTEGRIVSLTASDTIKVYGYVQYNSGATADAFINGGAEFTFLDIHLLSI